GPDLAFASAQGLDVKREQVVRIDVAEKEEIGKAGQDKRFRVHGHSGRSYERRRLGGEPIACRRPPERDASLDPAWHTAGTGLLSTGFSGRRAIRGRAEAGGHSRLMRLPIATVKGL